MKKRPVSVDDPPISDDTKLKKIKSQENPDPAESVLFDENLLTEVLKHADARTLATAACVNTQWHKTAQDERLWELICTKHWANIGYSKQQLRAVVLALGGFRRLYTLSIRPLLNPSSSSSPSCATWPCLPQASAPVPAMVPGRLAGNGNTRWGKDEVNLTLSLLSTRYFEKMNFKKNK